MDEWNRKETNRRTNKNNTANNNIKTTLLDVDTTAHVNKNSHILLTSLSYVYWCICRSETEFIINAQRQTSKNTY